jgi:hypothetical protein
VKNGTKLILADPRRSELARHATHYLQFKPDSDVAMLNALMHTIVEEGLVAEIVRRRPHERFRRAQANVAQLQSRRRWRRLRHPGADDCATSRAVRDVARVDDPVGHGHLAARARHRQRALPDRAVDDDGAGRAPGRACIRCAARTTCRAHPTSA